MLDIARQNRSSALLEVLLQILQRQFEGGCAICRLANPNGDMNNGVLMLERVDFIVCTCALLERGLPKTAAYLTDEMLYGSDTILRKQQLPRLAQLLRYE